MKPSQSSPPGCAPADGCAKPRSQTATTNNNTRVDPFIGVGTDIAFLRAHPQNNPTAGLSVVLDDIMFVPQPASLVLLSSAIFLRRRRR